MPTLTAACWDLARASTGLVHVVRTALSSSAAALLCLAQPPPPHFFFFCSRPLPLALIRRVLSLPGHRQERWRVTQ